MKISRALLVVSLLVFASGSLAAPAPARASASFAVGFFFDSLAPYGQWVASASFGTVWRPTRVGSGWRPYDDGRWVWTDDGWTFLSDEPWGWATYHYGRWYFDPVYGWLWIPGDEWGPAWVTFYSGPGWIGWAPLLPTSVRVGVKLRLDPRAYCFVDERHFLEPRVGRWAAPSRRNLEFVRSARVLARPVRRAGRWLEGGPSPGRLERVTRHQVPRLHVSELVDPRHGMRPSVRGTQVHLYRPRLPAHGGRPADVGRSPQQRLRPLPPARGSHAAPPRAARPRHADGHHHGRGDRHGGH